MDDDDERIVPPEKLIYFGSPVEDQVKITFIKQRLADLRRQREAEEGREEQPHIWKDDSDPPRLTVNEPSVFKFLYTQGKNPTKI